MEEEEENQFVKVAQLVPDNHHLQIILKIHSVISIVKAHTLLDEAVT